VGVGDEATAPPVKPQRVSVPLKPEPCTATVSPAEPEDGLSVMEGVLAGVVDV
jgi:hypothetical protein